MREVAEKLNLAQRTIPSIPLPTAAAVRATPPKEMSEKPEEEREEIPMEVCGDDPAASSPVTEAKQRLALHREAIDAALELEAMYADPSASKDTMPQSIVMDEEDEVKAEGGEEQVSACGPVEAKVLQGTDKRMYLLEMTRITPRDANYVPKDLGGTGRLPDDYLNSIQESTGICTTYLLRRELSQLYSSRETEINRQRLLSTALETLRGSKDGDASIASPKADVIVSDEETPSNEENKDHQITETELTSAYQKLLTDPENMKKMSATLSPLNVNCFMPFKADLSEETAEKDAANSRDLSIYLYDTLLPLLTEAVRGGMALPFDGEQLKLTLHNHGINLRYLGRLAELAQEQEAIDSSYSSRNSRRIRGMPFYWLEMLETEMIARAFKGLLGVYMRCSQDVWEAPGSTIVSMLNAILGAEDKSIDFAPAAIVPPAVMKGKGKKSKVTAGAVSDVAAPVPSPPDAVSSREGFLKDLNDYIMRRFHYSLTLLTHPDKPLTSTLRSLFRPSLLRRICRVSGIQIASRNYSFYDSALNLLANPITVADILGLMPLLKGELPSEAQPVREIRELIETSRSMMKVGRLEEGFALAQEASAWIQQAVGQVHKDASSVLEIMSGGLLRVGDYDFMSSLCEKNLALLIQIGGLDCAELVHTHFLLSLSRCQQNDLTAAAKHLNCAIYITAFIAGPRHPEIITMLLQLAAVYKGGECYRTSFRYLLEAQQKLMAGGSCDQSILAQLLSELADVSFKTGDIIRAVELQTNSFRITRQIFEANDDVLVARKKTLETYIRQKVESANLIAEGSDYDEINDFRAVKDAKSKNVGPPKVSNPKKSDENNTTMTGAVTVPETLDDFSSALGPPGDWKDGGKKKNKKSKK